MWNSPTRYLLLFVLFPFSSTVWPDQPLPENLHHDGVLRRAPPTATATLRVRVADGQTIFINGRPYAPHTIRDSWHIFRLTGLVPGGLAKECVIEVPIAGGGFFPIVKFVRAGQTYTADFTKFILTEVSPQAATQSVEGILTTSEDMATPEGAQEPAAGQQSTPPNNDTPSSGASSGDEKPVTDTPKKPVELSDGELTPPQNPTPSVDTACDNEELDEKQEKDPLAFGDEEESQEMPAAAALTSTPSAAAEGGEDGSALDSPRVFQLNANPIDPKGIIAAQLNYDKDDELALCSITFDGGYLPEMIDLTETTEWPEKTVAPGDLATEGTLTLTLHMTEHSEASSGPKPFPADDATHEIPIKFTEGEKPTAAIPFARKTDADKSLQSWIEKAITMETSEPIYRSDDIVSLTIKGTLTHGSLKDAPIEGNLTIKILR